MFPKIYNLAHKQTFTCRAVLLFTGRLASLPI